MRSKLFLICFAITTFLFANSKTDSLESALRQHPTEDIIRVDILNNLGYEYWIVNPINSIIYGQQAKVLSDVLNYKEGLAFANRVIGVAHWARGSYDQGLEYLLNSLKLYRTLSDTLGEANSLMNIGLIYSDRSDNDLALKYYFEALKLFEEVKAQNRSATTYVKLATIFIREGKLDAAQDFLKRAKFIHENDEFLYGITEILNRYGILKIEMNQYDSAKMYLQHSLEVSMKIEDMDGITKNYIDLAEVALRLRDFTTADKMLQEGLIYARKIQSHKWLKEIYVRLQQIARRNGDLKKAIIYYDSYVQERDSIFNEQTVNNIARLESELAIVEHKRQLDVREKEIVILEQKSELQRIRLIALTIAIVVVIVISLLFVKLRHISAKQKETRAIQEAEKVKRELEFKKRELVSYTVNFIQKNGLFAELITSVSELKKKCSDDTRKDLVIIERTIKRHLQIDKDWEDFKLRFESLHSGFFDQLLKREPSLTNNDLRLSVLVKMNFSIKEIAEMMGISTESVKTARYRFKKKLDLPADTTINDFLNSLG